MFDGNWLTAASLPNVFANIFANFERSQEPLRDATHGGHSMPASVNQECGPATLTGPCRVVSKPAREGLPWRSSG